MTNTWITNFGSVVIQELETGYWILNRIHLEKHSELTDYAWSTSHDIVYLVPSPPLDVYFAVGNIPSAMFSVCLFVVTAMPIPSE